MWSLLAMSSGRLHARHVPCLLIHQPVASHLQVRQVNLLLARWWVRYSIAAAPSTPPWPLAASQRGHWWWRSLVVDHGCSGRMMMTSLQIYTSASSGGSDDGGGEHVEDERGGCRRLDVKSIFKRSRDEMTMGVAWMTSRMGAAALRVAEARWSSATRVAASLGMAP